MNYRIKELAKIQNMSISELAEIINIKRESLSRIVNGASTSVETLQEIANALKVPITELFELENKDKLTALIDYRGTLYKAETVEQLKEIINEIEIREGLVK